MDINAIGTSGVDPKALQDMLRGENRTGQALEAVALAQSNPATVEKKDYVKATLDGMRAQSDQLNQQSALLNVAMAEAGASNSYAMRNLAGKRAARRFMEDMQQQVAEASQRALKESQDSAEKRAEKTATDGVPAQTATPLPKETSASLSEQTVAVSASIPESVVAVPAPAPEAAAPPVSALNVTV